MALMETMIVERLMNSAPIAGDKKKLHATATPAASGMAITLYPVAQTRF